MLFAVVGEQALLHQKRSSAHVQERRSLLMLFRRTRPFERWRSFLQ